VKGKSLIWVEKLRTTKSAYEVVAIEKRQLQLTTKAK
jgi:hypothetical protein